MKLTLISTSVMLIVWLFLAAAAVYLIYLIMKALRKYTKSMPVRKEKDENAKTLGEILKQHRIHRGDFRCQPAGCFQVGKRNRCAQHDEFDGHGKTIWR